MSGVADKGNASLGADPRRKGVAIYEFPVDKVVCRRRFDDLLDDGVPSFDDFETVFDLAGGGPGFFDIGIVLVYVKFVLLSVVQQGKYLMRANPTKVFATFKRSCQKVHIRPDPSPMGISILPQMIGQWRSQLCRIKP